MPELETARRWGLRTITVVNNNGCLAQGQKNLGLAQIEAGLAWAIPATATACGGTFCDGGNPSMAVEQSPACTSSHTPSVY